jgi:hypothetical protein
MSDIIKSILSKYDNNVHFNTAMDEGLNNLSEIKPFPVNDITDYLNLRDMQTALEYLHVYAANKKMGDEERASLQTLKAIHALFTKHSTRLRIKDKDTKSAAKYLVWKNLYTSLNNSRVIEYVADKGFIKKSLNSEGIQQLYVTGLHSKICDNSFTVDSRGREHRQYMTSNANFAIGIASDMPCSFLNDIEELSEFYTTSGFGQRKGLLRPIGMRSIDKHFITTTFT